MNTNIEYLDSPIETNHFIENIKTPKTLRQHIGKNDWTLDKFERNAKPRPPFKLENKEFQKITKDNHDMKKKRLEFKRSQKKKGNRYELTMDKNLLRSPNNIAKY